MEGHGGTSFGRPSDQPYILLERCSVDFFEIIAHSIRYGF